MVLARVGNGISRLLKSIDKGGVMTTSKQTKEEWEQLNGKYESDIPFEDHDICAECNYPIMYFSPENFSPINIDEKTGETYCDDCNPITDPFGDEE